MFDTSLTVVEVARRVAYTMAAGFTVANLNRVKMRPTWGYISLVSVTTLPVLFFFPFTVGFFLCRRCHPIVRG
jgi:ABC-type anion transport system duplicated permease subunit